LCWRKVEQDKSFTATFLASFKFRPVGETNSDFSLVVGEHAGYEDLIAAISLERRVPLFSSYRLEVLMSTWNYRVVKKNGYLGIHEAYYDDSGNIHSLSTDPVSSVFEDLEALKADIELMLHSLGKGIIDFDQIDSKSEST
jgi:hypothetical protein